eukprot:m.465221 g.465221  ORF g.465221 m.465221 type:complete len:410 (+) comp21626_c1_seq30:239-1468(+)
MILVMRQFTKALLVYTFGVHGWMHRSHSHNVQMRPVSLYWDTDNSDLVTDIPPGIIHAGAHGSNAPPTGNNGHTVNIYGNKGYFPHFLADGTAINGGLPQACNLTLHISRLEYDIRQLVPDPSFSGVCLLDFEQIRADWNSTEEIYRKKSIEVGGQRITYLALPENKRANITNAIAAYEDGARTLFLATINAVRNVRPGCQMGWYGYPTNALPHTITPAWQQYCVQNPQRCFFDHGGWGNATGYMGNGGAAQRKINDGLQWLFNALDVITPSVYLGIPNATNDADRMATTNYVTSTVREAVRLAGSRKPVIPCTWLSYDNYWQIPPPTPRSLLSAQDLRIELSAPLAAGADGILLWGALDVTASPSAPNSVSAMQQYCGGATGPLSSVVAAICSSYHCVNATAVGAAPS